MAMKQKEKEERPGSDYPIQVQGLSNLRDVFLGPTSQKIHYSQLHSTKANSLTYRPPWDTNPYHVTKKPR